VKLGGVRPGQEKARQALAQKATSQAEKLRGILEPLVSNQASLRAMATALQAAGVRTNGGREQWSPIQVSRVLQRLQLA